MPRLRAPARAGPYFSHAASLKAAAARRTVLALSSASDYAPGMPDDQKLTPADASDIAESVVFALLVWRNRDMARPCDGRQAPSDARSGRPLFPTQS
jgi:hypothetical protein